MESRIVNSDEPFFWNYGCIYPIGSRFKQILKTLQFLPKRFFESYIIDVEKKLKTVYLMIYKLSIIICLESIVQNTTCAVNFSFVGYFLFFPISRCHSEKLNLCMELCWDFTLRFFILQFVHFYIMSPFYA